MNIGMVGYVGICAFVMLVAPQPAGQGTQQLDTRRQYEQRMDEWYRLRDRAEKAWDDEMAREKAGDCIEALTTYDINICMGERVEQTRSNYKRYIDAVRAFRSLPPFGDVGASGPSGTPPTNEEAMRRFEAAETAWEKYQEGLCELDEDMARGGTIAPYEGMRCRIFLIRSHMREIGATFGR